MNCGKEFGLVRSAIHGLYRNWLVTGARELKMVWLQTMLGGGGVIVSPESINCCKKLVMLQKI